MVTLQLSPEESRELLFALEAQMHGLRWELATADIRDFKADLRARLDLLESIAQKLRPEAPLEPWG
jgi:hypothetical protein